MSEPDPVRLLTLLHDAAIPATQVLAARLHLRGVSEQDFKNLCKFPRFKDVPKEVRDSIASTLAAIRRGELKIDGRLAALAKQVRL